MIDEATIQKAVELLRQAAPASTIIVFGSCGRGDFREHSDLDVLVIQPRVTDQWDEMVRLRDALSPLGIVADVLGASQKTFDYWAGTPKTILYEAAREGRVFHAIQRTR